MKHIYFLSLLGLFSTHIQSSQAPKKLDFHALRLLVELNIATSEERAQYLSHKAGMGLLGKNKRTTRRSSKKTEKQDPDHLLNKWTKGFKNKKTSEKTAQEVRSFLHKNHHIERTKK